jgi:hypothetical protein
VFYWHVHLEINLVGECLVKFLIEGNHEFTFLLRLVDGKLQKVQEPSEMVVKDWCARVRVCNLGFQ